MKLLKKDNNHYPDKTEINFIVDKEEKTNRIAIILFMIFLVFLGFFVRYAVLGPLQKVADAERAYRMQESQLNAYKKEVADFDEIQRQYNEMVGDFLNEEEKNYLHRTDILTMIQEDVLNYTEIKSIQISGNTIRVTTGTTTLNTISFIVDGLLKDERNKYVTVKTTQTDNEQTDSVIANLEIIYGGAGE